MNVLVNKRDSIYFQLLRLLMFSAAIAALFFLTVNRVCDSAIEDYYETSEYEKMKDEKYIRKLQKYINENEITTKDTAKLKKWVRKQQIIALRVYTNNKKIFDSEYPDKDLWEEDIEQNQYEWETYYSVEFSDGEASVGIIGWYEYQLYNYALVSELILSFALFIMIVLLGIRKKMKYISELSHEIAILEGGSLDYQITIKGKDELSAMAEGLENMRISFLHMIEQQTQMVNENNKIITEMSHDLRTPVTSIMLYTEIIRKENYKNTEQLAEYIKKIDRKAHRMKQLTDHLFEYALISGEREIELEEPESCEILFYDLFSETCSYLEQNGFRVEFKVDWSDQKICVYTEYIVRIMDNISSNIIKYADHQSKVTISSAYMEKMIGFRFENTEMKCEEKKDSTGVGIQSVKNMMNKMGGICRVNCEKEIFAIEILFPCVK